MGVETFSAELKALTLAAARRAKAAVDSVL